MNLKPSMYFKDIYSINYQSLKQKGIKCLLFDIDNTIVPVDEIIPPEKTIKLFKELKKDFEVVLLSNALPLRVRKLKQLLSINGYCFSLKPLSRNYNRVATKYNLKSHEIAAIGDQLYTDIKGANKLSYFSILVDPISKKEFITTKITRHKENKYIEKTNIIKRGEYYE